MAGRTARLTDTDWILLKALWDRPPQTLGNIVASVQAAQKDINWSYKTYYTYLNNLCAKGYAGYDIRNAKADRLYHAEISREEAMEMESESLISRISGDQLGRLIATMARSDQLSEREQQELTELVNRLETAAMAPQQENGKRGE